MERLLNEHMIWKEEIERAYRLAIDEWTGCDWPTEFGKGSLNLNGLKASHAILLARATAGQEAADWQAAAEWLGQVERDARIAQELAGQACDLAREGNIGGASERVQRACAIEADYHKRLVWQPLREAIQSALSNADN